MGDHVTRLGMIPAPTSRVHQRALRIHPGLVDGKDATRRLFTVCTSHGTSVSHRGKHEGCGYTLPDTQRQGHQASKEVCLMSQPIVKKYPAEFKERAVKLAVESDQPIAQTARDLGINENTLHTWIGKYHRVERQTQQVNDEHLYEELKRLRKENTRLKEERDILKKAAAYFAQQLP
jgi:transposase